MNDPEMLRDEMRELKEAIRAINQTPKSLMEWHIYNAIGILARQYIRQVEAELGAMIRSLG